MNLVDNKLHTDCLQVDKICSDECSLGKTCAYYSIPSPHVGQRIGYVDPKGRFPLSDQYIIIHNLLDNNFPVMYYLFFRFSCIFHLNFYDFILLMIKIIRSLFI